MQNRSLVVLFALTALLGSSLLAGCGQVNTAVQVGTSLSGNWTFAPANSQVLLNLGFTQGAYETVSAVARLTGTSCVGPTTDIVLTGSVAGGSNQMMLVSSPFNGTTLTLVGQVSGNGEGIAGASWTFTGGNCASIGNGKITATYYSAINGVYTGTYVNQSSGQITVSGLLQQTSLPDENGQFSLSGTTTFANSSCFVDQPSVTSSLVTGSSFTATYTDPGSTAVLTTAGTFNNLATQLTITSWSISGGPCNGEMGTGSLTAQEQNL